MLAGNEVQPLGLAQALKLGLDEKHILIYLSDPLAADLLRARNWDGAVVASSPASKAPADSLLVVDSNVGFNKVDPNVDRSIHYKVDLAADGGPQARLSLTYHNRGRGSVGSCIQESRYG